MSEQTLIVPWTKTRDAFYKVWKQEHPNATECNRAMVKAVCLKHGFNMQYWMAGDQAKGFGLKHPTKRGTFLVPELSEKPVKATKTATAPVAKIEPEQNVEPAVAAVEKK